MSEPSPVQTRETILEVVADLLEMEGYDGVQLRDVARRARVSLKTIYKWFPTRNDLLIEAVGRWMDEHVYGHFDKPGPDDDVYTAMMGIIRTVLEPWEQHPAMLKAFHRARTSPGGDRLAGRGVAMTEPLASTLVSRTGADYLADIGEVVGNTMYGLISRYTDGQIEITEILPAMERAVFLLTHADSSSRTSASNARSED